MLYYLFDLLEKSNWSGAGLWQFITFRAGVAIIFSLIISLIFGGSIIKKLKKLQIGESIRDLGLEGQKEKEGTPTMGGVIIIMAILIPCLLVADLTNIYIQIMMLSTIWMGLIGGTDDYIKVFKKDKKGLSGKYKVIGQIVLGIGIALIMLLHEDVVVRMNLEDAVGGGYEMVQEFTDKKGEKVAYVKSTITNIPFLKGNNFDYQSILFFLGENAANLVWVIFVPIIVFLVTAVSNAANLTDGIDGLTTGITAIIAATLAVFAYVSGNVNAAQYLGILNLPGTGELVVFSACLIGACVGFLWYNTYPAEVFMGDTGSLTLGGIVAALAILLRKELLLPILCGVFMVETLSVMIQVSYFKYTKRKYGEGRRVFLMSPIHHHFQKQGIHESKIVSRFWIIGILLAVATILTLKIR